MERCWITNRLRIEAATYVVNHFFVLLFQCFSGSIAHPCFKAREVNETNYCPNCQTRGKLLADRALSRLLSENWPKKVDELG